MKILLTALPYLQNILERFSHHLDKNARIVYWNDIQFFSLASKYITFGIGKMIIVLTDETILSDDTEIPNSVQKHSKNDSKHENDRKHLLFLY